MKVTVELNTIEEVRDFLGPIFGEQPVSAAEPVKVEEPKAEPKKAATKKAEPKKAATKKAEPKKAATKKAEPKKEESKEDSKKFEFEDVRNAVNDLADIGSVETIKEVLSQFDVKTAKDLTEDQYAEFIQTCEEHKQAA